MGSVLSIEHDSLLADAATVGNLLAAVPFGRLDSQVVEVRAMYDGKKVLSLFVQESDCREIGIKFVQKTSQQSTESGVTLRVHTTSTWRVCSPNLTEAAYFPDSSWICYIDRPVCHFHVRRGATWEVYRVEWSGVE
jgi:hypothetical protein